MDSKIVSCVICSLPVSLEEARIDENGQPVHEECYMNKIGARPSNPEEKE